MSDDPLVQRLRASTDDHIEHGDRVDTDILDEAADRIEALEAELAEMRDFIGEPCTLEDLKASIDRHRAELAAVGDPNRTSVFEYMRDADGTVTACRTVTTSGWRPL